MLKGDSEAVDLEEIRDSIIAQSESGLSAIEQKFGRIFVQSHLNPILTGQ